MTYTGRVQRPRGAVCLEAKMRRAVPLPVLCFGLLFAVGAAAQSAVAGSVTDGTGAVLPGGTWKPAVGP